MSLSKRPLTVESLRKASRFAEAESSHSEPSLYGVDNGKSIGTYLEKKFRSYLSRTYDFERGNAASGIDLPGLNVDIKTTRSSQPQSSSCTPSLPLLPKQATGKPLLLCQS